MLLDFTKDFDKVQHSRLIHKLIYYGVNTEIININNINQRVVLEGEKSTPAEIVSGVPQWSVPGILSYSRRIHINDMPETLHHSETRLYADDTILFRVINSQTDRALL